MKILLPAVLAWALVVNGTAVAQQFPYATARRGCTQEDARALELFFTQQPFDGGGLPTRPYIRVEVSWGDWVIGQDLTLVPLARRSRDQRVVVRAELSRDSRTPVWLNGTVRLTKVDVDRSVAGTFDFALPDGGVWQGTFDTGWIAGGHRCG